jgi:hypothetical protein
MEKLFLPPVPEWWSDKAAIEGKENNSTGAYHIGHIIWRQYRLRKKSTGLKLPVANLNKKGFGRSYVRSALASLEGAGLITVKRFKYQSPEITLITDEKESAKLITLTGSIHPRVKI